MFAGHFKFTLKHLHRFFLLGHGRCGRGLNITINHLSEAKLG